MAQISSQSKDDLGYGSSSSRGPERCSRRRKGRSRDWKPCCLPAPSQLFEALNNLNNDSGEWNKRWQGELVETHKIFFFFAPSPHERRQTVTYNEWCESLRQKKPTKPQPVCSCNGCAAALLHPFPVLLPSPHGRHYMQIYSRAVSGFSVAPAAGERSHASRGGCLVPLPAVPSLAAPASGTKRGGSLIHQISQLLPNRVCVCICPWMRVKK